MVEICGFQVPVQRLAHISATHFLLNRSFRWALNPINKNLLARYQLEPKYKLYAKEARSNFERASFELVIGCVNDLAYSHLVYLAQIISLIPYL